MGDITTGKFGKAVGSSPTEQPLDDSGIGETPTGELDIAGTLKIAGDAGNIDEVLTKDPADNIVRLKVLPVPPGSFHTRAQTNSQTEPPNDNRLMFNEIVLNTSTELYIDYTTSQGQNIPFQMQTNIVAGSRLFIQLKSDQDRFIEYSVTSSSDEGTYLKVPGSVIASAGAEFPNNSDLVIVVLEGTSLLNASDLKGELKEVSTLAVLLAANPGKSVAVNAAGDDVRFVGDGLFASQEDSVLVTTADTMVWENSNMNLVAFPGGTGMTIVGNVATNTSGSTKTFFIVWNVAAILAEGGGADSISIKAFKNNSIPIPGKSTTTVKTNEPGTVNIVGRVTLDNLDTVNLKVRNNSNGSDIIIQDSTLWIGEV